MTPQSRSKRAKQRYRISLMVIAPRKTTSEEMRNYVRDLFDESGQIFINRIAAHLITVKEIK